MSTTSRPVIRQRRNGFGPFAAVEDIGLEPGLALVATERQAHAEPRRATHEERQVEAEDVVVLEHVGIARLHQLDEALAAAAVSPSADDSRHARQPRLSRMLIMKMRSRSSSSPVVSRSNCMRSRSSNAMSLKYVRPLRIRNCSIGGQTRTRPRRSLSDRASPPSDLLAVSTTSVSISSRLLRQHEIAIGVLARIVDVEIDHRERLASARAGHAHRAGPPRADVALAGATASSRLVVRNQLGNRCSVSSTRSGADAAPDPGTTPSVGVDRHDARGWIAADQPVGWREGSGGGRCLQAPDGRRHHGVSLPVLARCGPMLNRW